jgi:hypothetical protein
MYDWEFSLPFFVWLVWIWRGVVTIHVCLMRRKLFLLLRDALNFSSFLRRLTPRGITVNTNTSK